MKPPQKPSDPDDPPPLLNPTQEFERVLEDTECSLVNLKQRYAQIQYQQQQQVALKEQLDQGNQNQHHADLQELKVELKRLQDELEALDNFLGLFSETCVMVTIFGSVLIFSKSSLKEAFWQAVRLGGLGIVVGWVLKSCVG